VEVVEQRETPKVDEVEVEETERSKLDVFIDALKEAIFNILTKGIIFGGILANIDAIKETFKDIPELSSILEKMEKLNFTNLEPLFVDLLKIIIKYLEEDIAKSSVREDKPDVD
jgi:hypothetical protein